MENYGGSLKNSILGEFHEKSIHRGELPPGGGGGMNSFQI